MKRRQAILGIVLLAAGRAAGAQQARKLPRIAVLHIGNSKEPAPVQREPFERGLRENGWLPGSNVLIEYRYADGNEAKLRELARDVARSGVDVIVARGWAAIDAARQATSSIAIVMSATNDPVGEGLVRSLSQPGGNITGIAVLVFELDPKRLELLKENFPHVARVAVLTNPTNDGASYDERVKALHRTAAARGLQLLWFEPRQVAEVARTLDAIGQAKPDALLVRGDPGVIDPSRLQIIAMAARQRIPAIYPWRFFAEAGGLMSYGSSLPGFHHRSATYVSQILKGAKPGALAIEQPTTFELVVNMKTAKSIGIELPKALLFRADEVIQ